MDVCLGFVLEAVLLDELVSSANAFFVLDVDLDTTSIRLVEDLGGNDLHDDRESNLLCECDSLVLSLGEA